MARAETVPSVAESGVGGIAAFSHPISCGMAMPRPLLAWPGLLAANMVLTAGSVHALPRQAHALQACYVTQNTRDLPAAASPSLPSTSCGRTTAVTLCDSSPSLSSEQQQQQQQQQHQPDSAPVWTPEPHPAWASDRPVISDPVEETDQELDVRRVAHQLRTIGDEFNASVRLRMRVHQGQHWLDFCRRLLDFITQTLSVLHRLT